MRVITSVCFLSAAFLSCKVAKKKTVALTQSQEIEFQRIYIDATSAFVLKNNADADSLLKICIKLKPEEPSVYYLKAKVDCSTLNFNQALTELNEGLKFESNNQEIHLLHADVLAHLGQYKEAGLEVEALYNLNLKKSYFARQAIGYYVSGGFVDKALVIFNVMESQFGIREDIIFGKESLLTASYRYNESIVEVRKLITKYPHRYSYLEKLASIYQRAGNLDKCEETTLQLLNLDSDNGFGLLTMADISLRKNNPEKEYEYLQKAFIIPSISFEIKQSALTGYSLKHPNAISDGKLMKLAEYISLAHPTVPLAQVVLADIQFENKLFKEAVLKYQSILKDFTSNAEVYRKFLVCFEQLYLWDSLALHATKSLELFPNQFVFYYLNAEGLLKINKADEALLNIKTAKNYAFNPDDLFQIRLLEADIIESKGDYTACREIYNELLVNNPSKPIVLNNYSYHLAKTKYNLDKATEMSLQVLKLEPQNISFLDTYAWVLFAKEDYAKAMEYIEKAIVIKNSDPEILEHAGDIYFKNNLKEKAIEFWIKSKQNGGNGTQLDKKIKERKYFG